jgi:hypothetical protein
MDLITVGRWALGALLLALFLWVGTLNGITMVHGLRGVRRSSWIPFMAGAAGAAGVLLVPIVRLHAFWWVPFLLDPGSVLGLSWTALFYTRRALRGGEERFACSRCGSELMVDGEGAEENMDGGPGALTTRLHCATCGLSFKRYAQTPAIMTPEGVRPGVSTIVWVMQEPLRADDAAGRERAARAWKAGPQG